MIPLPINVEAKILRGPEGACWIWTGARSTNGYGNVIFGGRIFGAHRLIYRLLVGPVPRELDLDHLCRVRWCVNPAHLEPVTRQVNLLRAHRHVGKGWCDLYCKRGHRKYASKCQTCKFRLNVKHNNPRKYRLMYEWG